MAKNTTAIIVRIGAEGPVKEFTGRRAWALSNLLAAGDQGCTPINHPGPPWSDYVFKLKREGLAIETVTRSHGGSYSGHHSRYVLNSTVTAISEEAAHG